MNFIRRVLMVLGIAGAAGANGERDRHYRKRKVMPYFVPARLLHVRQFKIVHKLGCGRCLSRD
jgi:hypothetical protein